MFLKVATPLLTWAVVLPLTAALAGPLAISKVTVVLFFLMMLPNWSSTVTAIAAKGLPVRTVLGAVADNRRWAVLLSGLMVKSLERAGRREPSVAVRV